MSGARPARATSAPSPQQSSSAERSPSAERPGAAELSAASPQPDAVPRAAGSVRSVGVISGGMTLVDAERLAMADVDLVIAVDSGLDLALAAALRVDLALGDFDSVSPAALARAVDDGIEIARFSNDKDETDLELAMLRAIESEPERIVVVGLAGGRPDHALTSLLLLADSRWSTAAVTGHVGDAIVTILRGGIDQSPTRLRLDEVARGDLVSVIPVGGDAHGVSTVGLRWPLVDETLRAHSPRGMSNVVEADPAEVHLRRGTLLVFQPSADESPVEAS